MELRLERKEEQLLQSERDSRAEMRVKEEEIRAKIHEGEKMVREMR
jgi:hypothetical protein